MFRFCSKVTVLCQEVPSHRPASSHGSAGLTSLHRQLLNIHTSSRAQAAADTLKPRSKIISLRAPTSVNCFSFAFYTPVAATSKIHNPFPHLVAQAPLFDSIHESKSSPTHITNQLKFSPRQLSFSYLLPFSKILISSPVFFRNSRCGTLEDEGV